MNGKECIIICALLSVFLFGCKFAFGSESVNNNIVQSLADDIVYCAGTFLALSTVEPNTEKNRQWAETMSIRLKYLAVKFRTEDDINKKMNRISAELILSKVLGFNNPLTRAALKCNFFINRLTDIAINKISPEGHYTKYGQIPEDF